MLTRSHSWFSAVQPYCIPKHYEHLLYLLHKLQKGITWFVVFITVLPNVLYITEYIISIHILNTIFEIAAYCSKIHRFINDIKIILIPTTRLY